MAQLQTIARKYAKGLYEACHVTELLAVRQALCEVAQTIAANPSVMQAVKNPAISEADKSAALVAIVAKLASKTSGQSPSITNLVTNLMKVLVQNHRAHAIVEVAASFEEIVARHFKMSQIEISSARQLDSHERSSYEGALRQQLGPQTEVSFSIDPELLGGMQVKAGDVLIDGSVRTSLQQLRTALLG